MIPKIKFRYSWIYDERYRKSLLIQEKLKNQKKTYPSTKTIINYIKKIEPEWHKIEKVVFREISKLSGLPWKEKEIICYVIGFGRPFSDPLTIKLYPQTDDFIDTLVHELIHQIQIQNVQKYKKFRAYVEHKYKVESITTKNHIFVHALHEKIYLKLFNKKRLEKDIKNSEDNPDYKRAWDIVAQEGHGTFIKKFKELTEY